jgi:hypothetical protein
MQGNAKRRAVLQRGAHRYKIPLQGTASDTATDRAQNISYTLRRAGTGRMNDKPILHENLVHGSWPTERGAKLHASPHTAPHSLLEHLCYWCRDAGLTPFYEPGFGMGRNAEMQFLSLHHNRLVEEYRALLENDRNLQTSLNWYRTEVEGARDRVTALEAARASAKVTVETMKERVNTTERRGNVASVQIEALKNQIKAMEDEAAQQDASFAALKALLTRRA